MHVRRSILGVALGACVLGTTAIACAQVPAGVPDVRVTPVAESLAVHAGTTARLALAVDVPERLHLQSNKPREAGLIPTTIFFEPPAGVTVTELVFPPSTDFEVRGYDQPLAVFERRFTIGVTIQLDETVSLGELVLPGRLRYQACDETQCFRPTTVPARWTLRVVPASEPVARGHVELFGAIPFGTGEPPPVASESLVPAPAATADRADEVLALLDDFTILGTGVYMDSAEFIEFIRNAEAGITPRGLLDGRGPLAILGLVFLGGLALNLTPCVLPMIPINLGIIGAGAQSGRRGRGFLLGATYGAAMALVYGTLGFVVILTASTFGTINASPWFNLGIAALFVVLALAMFDVIAIDFSRLSSRFQFAGAQRGTFFLAFGMGAVAALLAGACVAPVVIQVIVFAGDLYAAGTSIALALPFVLGLGMAAPWPLAGAGIAALPKPGAWMVRVKQALGVFILATAAYYGYVAYGIFASRWVDPASVQASVQEKLDAGWYSSLSEGLRVAQRDNTPVLIDLWATWCKNCLIMDRTTLADPAVLKALEGYTLIKFQAEDPDRSPAREVMRHVGARGLPTYVILKPKSSSSSRATTGSPVL